MSFTAPQRHRAIGLYKKLLRTTRKTFAGDENAVLAAKLETRRRFKEAAKETDPVKIEEGLDMADEIVTVFRKNVVQGKWSDSSRAYHLRMTPETELGSNDSIKKARQQQINDIKAGKGPSHRKCSPSPCSSNTSSSSSSTSSSTGSSSASFSTFSTASSSNASSMQARAFSTGSVLFRSSKAYQRSAICSAAFSTSSKASDKDPFLHSSQAPLPRPVPKFHSVTILADGSSIQLYTTSPRKMTRLTRDPTNHPLWNPGQERKVGGDAEDDSGRLGRFRRRFGESSNEAAAAGDASASSAAAASESRVAPQDDVSFDQDDLSWMSGGREARAGSPILAKKSGKKGKK
ncbi:hypothetical protein IE53DRAFT_348587 [Violaceomyces palustris]|uniref:Uncharacterized protein n=1 Tax=Violaceomyces palustris TaxID=1673888 RepID=A0ACD0NPV1_9BASI|nr:hypothetical protein IE53DRAFT_348587 [Violaceomyces palustris]